MPSVHVRNVPEETRRLFNIAARRRGQTQADYLAALIALHQRARALADSGYGELQTELKALGLQSVRE